MNKVRLMQEAARCLLCENAPLHRRLPCRLICRTGAIGISKRVPKRKKA